MKSLIVLLSMAFSVNSFAHGTYLNPTERMTLSPFFGTSFTEGTINGTSASTASQKVAKKVLMDAQEFRQSGIASVALDESMNIIQATHEVSDEEAVDMLVAIAQGILN